jgi:hypothetical protein
MARRAAGLDEKEGSNNVNVNLQLVNQRIRAIWAGISKVL